MAVRRLRVFTVIIQCTHRIPRLIESSKFVATAVFLARLACIEMVKQSLEEDEHTAGDAARHPTKAIQMIDAWAATLLVAQATALRSVSSSAAAAVEEALAQSSMRKLLAMLFGITQTLGLHALLNTSSAVETGQLPSLLTAMPRQPGPGSKPIATLSVADSDTLVAQQSIVQTVDAYECHKIFYPSCHAITAEDFVVCDPISLSREAMVINAASSFLLDSAQEIVLFRESQPATAGARERQTTAETGEDAPTVESGDEDDYREVTLDPRDAQHSSTSSIALLAGKPPLALETFVGIRALNVLSRGQGQSGSRQGEGEGDYTSGDGRATRRGHASRGLCSLEGASAPRAWRPPLHTAKRGAGGLTHHGAMHHSPVFELNSDRLVGQLHQEAGAGQRAEGWGWLACVVWRGGGVLGVHGGAGP